MTSTRKTALWAGVLFCSPSSRSRPVFLYTQVRGANYIVGPGPDTRVYIGVILEMIVALAGIGTAVALYPVVKRQNEGVALGFVGTRTLEAATIFGSVATLMAVVALRQAGAGAAELATGHALIERARLDLPLWTGPHAGRERLAARLPALPVAPGAAGPSRAGIHRCGAARRFHYGYGVRCQRVRLRGLGAPLTPDRNLGVSLGVYLIVKGFRAEGLQKLGLHPCPRGRAASRRRRGSRRRDKRLTAGHADRRLVRCLRKRDRKEIATARSCRGRGRLEPSSALDLSSSRTRQP